jgi:hypothetical protein
MSYIKSILYESGKIALELGTFICWALATYYKMNQPPARRRTKW